MPLILDDAARESLRLAGRALRLALADRDLNRGQGREVRASLSTDREAFDALELLGEELGLRFVWSGEARLDAVPLPDSPFAWTKADLRVEGFKDPHLFVAIALGIAAFFFPDGDFAGDPVRQEGTLAAVDDYLCDRMKQASLRTDLPRLGEAQQREVAEFVAAWVEKAQSAPGAGQRKSRFADLKKALRFLEVRRYVRLDGDRDESLRVYPAERLRILSQTLESAPHYDLLLRLLRDPTCALPLPDDAATVAAGTEEP